MMKRILWALLALCLTFGACAALAEDEIVAEPVEAAVADADEVWLDDPAEPAPAQQVSAGAARSPEVLSVAIDNPVEDEYAWVYMYPLTMQKEAIRFTVHTNLDAKYLYLLNSNGKQLKKWSASGAAKTVTVNGVKQRKWTVKYKISSTGLKTMSFGASYGVKSKPVGKKNVLFEVLETAVIKSVTCTPKKPDVGQEIKFTLKANDAANYLSILDSRGKALGSYNTHINHQDDGTVVITGCFTLDEGGSQKITFKASYNGSRGVATKKITINVKDNGVKSARFYKSNVYAGDAIKAQVITGNEAAALGMFDSNGKLIADWEADKNSTLLDGQRVWTVKTTLRRIGKRTYSFRSRATPLEPYMGDDADQFGPGKNATITVKGKKIVNVTNTNCAIAHLNNSGWYDYKRYWNGGLCDDFYLASVDMLLVTVGAPDNARYIHIYNESGKQILRKKLDENTMSYLELESVKQWYVPVYLMKGFVEWGETFTVKASVDGTNVGQGKTFSIKGIDPEPLSPGESVSMYVSGVNYPEESLTGVSFTATESRIYTIWTNDRDGDIHYLLYRAGSNQILKDDIATDGPIEGAQCILVDAQAGVTYVLRLDLRSCSGANMTLRCS